MAVALNQLKPTPVARGKEVMETPHYSSMINLVIWNVRGANSATFSRHCEALLETHKTVVLVLLEIKMV